MVRCRNCQAAAPLLRSVPALPFLVLRFPEQDFVRLVVERFASCCQHFGSALDRRTGADLIEPALRVRVIGPVYALIREGTGPGKAGDIGDAVVVAGEVGSL